MNRDLIVAEWHRAQQSLWIAELQIIQFQCGS